MSGFHFFKVLKFKIRRGGVVEDTSLPHLAPSATSGFRSTVLQVPKMATDNPHTLSALEATSDVPSTSIPARPVPLPESARQSGKGKAGAKSGEEDVPGINISPHRISANTSTIGSRQDKLDPTVLGKLPPAVAIAGGIQFISIGLLPLGRRQTPRK
ncbi:hypothetical protein Fot_42546 [Forsythia ovata]|uniref:Uncharacterized protein n=1 Tax=Forsythia ovata TaxID=205694 RepID=A0ABD1RMG7_9LAMI